MTLERHIADLASARRIDDGQRALAVADDDPVAPRIEADIVGIVAERDLPDGRKSGPWNSRTEPSPALAT